MKIQKKQKSSKRMMFAVIADEVSSELNRIDFPVKLKDWDTETIREMVEFLASVNSAWCDVLKGTRVAMIFDAASGDKISINRKVTWMLGENTL